MPEPESAAESQDLPSSSPPPSRMVIEEAILEVRGQRVLFDEQLAALYGVPVGSLIQAVNRNRTRFPGDFMFRLTEREVRVLRARSVIARTWGGRRSRPCAFTEQGVAMLSSVLRSPRAVLVNIEIMRAFVRLRRAVMAHADLSRRLDALEARYDDRFREVFDALRALMEIPRLPGGRIGFGGPGQS